MKTVDNEASHGGQVPIAFAQGAVPIGVEHHVHPLRRQPLHRRPKGFGGLIDDRVGAESASDVHLVRGAHHRQGPDPGVAAELQQGAADPPRRGMDQRGLTRSGMRQLMKSEPGGQKDHRECRGLGHRPSLRHGEYLIRRHGQPRTIAAEARDHEDLVALRDAHDAIPDCRHPSGRLEARRNRVSHVLACGGIQAHADHAIGVIDPGDLHVHEDLAGPGDWVRHFRQA